MTKNAVKQKLELMTLNIIEEKYHQIYYFLVKIYMTFFFYHHQSFKSEVYIKWIEVAIHIFGSCFSLTRKEN